MVCGILAQKDLVTAGKLSTKEKLRWSSVTSGKVQVVLLKYSQKQWPTITHYETKFPCHNIVSCLTLNRQSLCDRKGQTLGNQIYQCNISKH